jgi:hypothetical protein
MSEKDESEVRRYQEELYGEGKEPEGRVTPCDPIQIPGHRGTEPVSTEACEVEEERERTRDDTVV